MVTDRGPDGSFVESDALELDHDEWHEEQLAVSYISREGNLYYYRRIPAFDAAIWTSGAVSHVIPLPRMGDPMFLIG